MCAPILYFAISLQKLFKRLISKFQKHASLSVAGFYCILCAWIAIPAKTTADASNLLSCFRNSLTVKMEVIKSVWLLMKTPQNRLVKTIVASKLKKNEAPSKFRGVILTFSWLTRFIKNFESFSPLLDRNAGLIWSVKGLKILPGRWGSVASMWFLVWERIIRSSRSNS